MQIKKAIIPAGGFGTRMLPATKSIPKEMLPIVDRPSIQYVVEEAVESGIRDIIVITNRTKTVMEDHFDYAPDLEARLRSLGKEQDADAVHAIADMANITFLRQKEPRGLGHAVWCARELIGDEPFAVLLGDDIIKAQAPVTAQLMALLETGATSVVGVKQVPRGEIHKYCTLDLTPFAPGRFDVRRIIEKPEPHEILSDYAILGRYLLPPDIFDILETLPPGRGGEIQLTDALNLLCQRSRMVACLFEGRRFDCGSPAGYLEAVLEYARDNPSTADFLRQYIEKSGC